MIIENFKYRFDEGNMKVIVSYTLNNFSSHNICPAFGVTQNTQNFLFKQLTKTKNKEKNKKKQHKKWNPATFSSSVLGKANSATNVMAPEIFQCI